MIFRTEDWFYCGPGNLFGPPFLTSCLLYRLFDLKYSLLIYHDSVVHLTSEGIRQKSVMEFRTVVREPNDICIAGAHSLDCGIGELAALAPLRVVVSRSSSSRQILPNLIVQIDPIKIPVCDMFMVSKNTRGNQSHQISNTPYIIEGLVKVERLQVNSEAAFRCWRIAIENSNSGEIYGFTSMRSWSVEAMCDISEEHSIVKMGSSGFIMGEG